MNPYDKSPGFSGKRALFCLITAGILIGFLPVLGQGSPDLKDYLLENRANLCPDDSSVLPIVNGNSLLSASNPTGPDMKVTGKVNAVLTAYSSTVWETDETPYVTASGSWVREGIVANNYFPFGTKIRIPELYGERIFTIEDRMSWKKSNNHFDVWFPSNWQAKNFGSKYTYIEVLEKVN